MIPRFPRALTLTLPPDVVTVRAGRRCPTRSGGIRNRRLPCLPPQPASPATLELGEASLPRRRRRPRGTPPAAPWQPWTHPYWEQCTKTVVRRVSTGRRCPTGRG